MTDRILRLKMDLSPEHNYAMSLRVGKLLQSGGVKEPDDAQALSLVERGVGVRCLICKSVCVSAKDDDKYVCYSCGITARKDGQGIYDNVTGDHLFKFGDVWIAHLK
jgi:hypothetical protein